MALRSELMALGIAAGPAHGLGGDTLQALVPAGTNQAGAAAITSPYASAATTGSGTGALLPTAENKPIYAVFNGDAANALLVYPTGSQTINGASSFSVTHGKTAMFIPLGINWLAVLSA